MDLDHFWNLENFWFSMAANLLKTISDDSIWHAKGHPSILEKIKSLILVWIWSDSYGLYMYALKTWYLLLAQEEHLLLVEEDLLLVEEEDSSCTRRRSSSCTGRRSSSCIRRRSSSCTRRNLLNTFLRKKLWKNDFIF